MGVSNRLKGIDVQMAFSGPDGPEDSLQKFKSFEITFDGEIILEDYLGEATPQTDDISNGIKIKATVHLNDPDVFDFMVRVENRRQRLASAAGKFSAIGNFNFPDGQVRRIVVPDIAFGALPIRAGDRKRYVETEIDGAASVARLIK